MSTKLLFLTSFVLVLGLVGTHVAFGETIEVRVAASDDDAEENLATGVMDSLTSSDLEITEEGSPAENQLVGMRFNNIAVPQGAIITSAYVQFHVDEIDVPGDNRPGTKFLRGEAVDNAAGFSSTDLDISSRPTTSAEASWDWPLWLTVHEEGPDQQTPDISAVIQEIVDRPGWSTGNSLALIITGTGENTAESFDGEADAAALLHVDFTPAPVAVDNLALNPSLEDDEVILDDPTWEAWATWNAAEGAGSNATIVDTESVDGARSLRVDPIGVANWHFIVANISFPLTAGANATVTFWAKAEAPRPLAAQVKAADNSVTWGYTDFQLTTEWAEYTMTSPAESDAGKIEFLCAGVEVPLWLDFVQAYEGEFVAGIEPRPAVTIPVDPNADIAAANELAQPGDTVEFAEGTYYITSQIEIKDGVTYQGAGAGLTIIDGGGATRAFVAWGDLSATNGLLDTPNTTGPTGWVLDGLTIQNCVADAAGRQDILSAARDLLNNYAGAPYTLATAQAENGGVTSNPEWFDILSGGADDDLTDAELQAYLDANPVGSAGHLVANDDMSEHGAAVIMRNGAQGTIQNCEFSNNSALDGSADGGAINVSGAGLALTIDNCAFNGNSCADGGGALRLVGRASTFTITNTTFTANISNNDGGAIRADGDDSSYVWTGCTFIGNYATDDGAAVRYSPDRAELTMSNCSFIGNGKDADGNVVGDDGVWQCKDDDAGSITFENCLFADNACNDDRFIELKAVFSLLNCTFINNVAGDKALIAVRGRDWDSTGDGNDDVTTDDSIIANCLFINNTLLSDSNVIGDTRNDVFAPTVINCLFFGNLDGADPANNTNGDSVEVGTIDVSAVTDAAQIVVDNRPVAGSPAIDASDPATATASDIEGTPAVGVRDVGAYEAN